LLISKKTATEIFKERLYIENEIELKLISTHDIVTPLF